MDGLSQTLGAFAVATAPPSEFRRAPLSEMLSALSFALDLTEGQPAGHCMRACWIALAVGRQIGLPRTAMWELYYTTLLKDLGCSSNASRLSHLYMTDDIAFKRDYKKVAGFPGTVSFILSHTGDRAPLTQRVGQFARVVRGGRAAARELIETRCMRGGAIARRMRFSDAVGKGIESLDEHWNGRGLPHGLSGLAIPLYARVALLAQVVDIFHISAGPRAALAEVRRRSGSWFDPALARALEAVAGDPGFWSALDAPDLEQRLLNQAPALHCAVMDDAFLDDIAVGFASVIDAKSPFTAGHSERVALLSDAIAQQLGCDPKQRRWLRRMALLHDIGKLGVSNIILEKPGPLDAAERATMERHAAHTGEILSRISAFATLAPLAAAHHERLDGKGYPLGLKGDEIAFETRILTVADIFDALSADRPYRKAMPLDRALDILRNDIGTSVDGRCVRALEAVLQADGTLTAPL
ncbi:HD domain-containing phosphohydrolase [Xanthobacter sp. VNH20]|uniref:HD-GYP domain-containing protein n=1 Tax=Xanthobacter sp. VNH20 TaxID=3156616 RepID=UPI0032B4BDED